MIANIVIDPQESQENFERFRVKSLLPLQGSQFSGRLIRDQQDHEELIISTGTDNIERARVGKFIENDRKGVFVIADNTFRVGDANTFYSRIIEFKNLVELIIDCLYGQLKKGDPVRYKGQSACITIPKDTDVAVESTRFRTEIIKPEPSIEDSEKSYSQEKCELCVAWASSGQYFKSKCTVCEICREETTRVLRSHNANQPAICSFECEYRYYIANLSIEAEATQ